MIVIYDHLTMKVPIKSWCTDLEDKALEQAMNLANLPFTFKHIALAPDCHLGYGMPIGGILATKGVVIPNAVGVDVGCGMCAIQTNITEDISKDDLKKIMGLIRTSVPVGMNRHKHMQPEKYMPDNKELRFASIWKNKELIVCKEYDNALYSLGSLGGGNHFCEIQRGSDSHIWIMVHSGSRNLGKKVADHYNKIAKQLNEKWFSSIPSKWDLAFLPLDTQDAQDYLLEMNYCVEYALSNRELMLERIKDAFYATIDGMQFSDIINIAHNYARLENHFGSDVLVHRKGATSAKKDEIGIIPGSQGTSSYIVKGLGNKESFESCSHGAGRQMGRAQAQKTLDLTAEIKKLDDQGIIHGIRTINDLDEAAGAYKDVKIVMENQKDLVEIVVELKPLAVIKG